MILDQFQEALTRFGVDATHIKGCEITCNHVDKIMRVVVTTFARNEDGKRYTIWDSENGTRVAATEQKVVDLDELIAASRRSVDVTPFCAESRSYISVD